MRKLIATTMVSLDGVMQAPGGPEEDPSGGFAFGGWSFSYWDDAPDRDMRGLDGKDRELVLGRRTYEIFEAYWPYQTADNPIAQTLNAAKKHVASRTLKKVQWNNSTLLRGDVDRGRGGAQVRVGTGPADHRQRQPDPDAAGCIADRRVQRVDLPGRARARQAAVRSRRKGRRAATRRFASLGHRCRDEHVRAGRRGDARIV